MDCEIHEMVPTAVAYNMLRAAVDWGTYEHLLIDTALPHSLYCVCALLQDQVIGMARIIGDGGLVYYVQDVIVLPEYQRQGIGTRLMAAIIEYLRSNVSPNSVIGLMAAAGKEPFYARYGFTARPCGHLGCGMTMAPGLLLAHEV